MKHSQIFNEKNDNVINKMLSWLKRFFCRINNFINFNWCKFIKLCFNEQS